MMPYLKEGDETTLSWNLGLTEAGNMGHIVPGHHYLLELVGTLYAHQSEVLLYWYPNPVGC